MITFVKGDLIALSKEGKFDAIAHQCNCFCTMRSGIAPKIAQAFPVAFEADCSTERGDSDKMGTYSRGFDDRYDLHIFNIYGQYGWNRNFPAYGTNYEALFEGLERMKDFCTGLGAKRIGFPLIGCGLAGGDWNKVLPKIEELFKDFDVTIVEFDSSQT